LNRLPFVSVTEIDRNINNYFVSRDNPWLRAALGALTYLGTGALWLAIYALFLIFFRDHFTQLIYILVLAEATALPVVVVLRYMTKRERPAISHNYFFLAPWNRYSFPSHHALRAFIVLVVVGKAFPAFLPILIVMALIVGFSRLYLAKHYLSDVLVGALLGIILALVSQKFI